MGRRFDPCRGDQLPTYLRSFPIVPRRLAWAIATSTAGAAAVRELPFAADKSVELDKPDASGTTSLAIAFAPQHGRVVFDSERR